jgi:hypothetical protein
VRNHLTRSIWVLAAVAAFLSVMPAQTAGQANPTASSPAASVPDLSGVWQLHAPSGDRYQLYNLTKDEPPMTPWAEERFKAAKPSFGPRAVEDSNDPVNPTTVNAMGCFPPGVPRIYLHPFPVEIIQIPGRVIMLFEFDHFIRQIYTDGRGHNTALGPTWMGDAIGKWDGDTLVVDTVGFNDKTWLDRGGHPHSTQLHLVERFRRADHDTLEDDVTIEDPIAYTKPWDAHLTFRLHPKWNIMEQVCEDNVNFNQFIKNEKKPSN